MPFEFLKPVEPNLLPDPDDLGPQHIGSIIQRVENEDDLENVDLAILGVLEERGAVNNKGCSQAPNEIRKHLYQLYRGDYNLRLVDMGNIEPGASKDDTYAALSHVSRELISRKIIPIIIGGSHDLTYGQFRAYEISDIFVNLVMIDERIDIMEESQTLTSGNFLYRILTHLPNILMDFSLMGYQGYYAAPGAMETLHKLMFDCHRLGKMRADMEEVEPIMRDADLLSFDISSIRQSDAPGNGNASPNGFTGEEACSITRYAGLTDKLSSIGFYESNPKFDLNGQTSQLVAQMIWYFIEGFYNRKKDYPVRNNGQYIKYTVDLKGENHQLVFWKSKKSERWWIEVPNVKSGKKNRSYFVSCSYSDYQLACQDEVPDKWLRAFEKLN